MILSDMCPSVSGIGSRDAALSGELGSKVLHLALGCIDDDESKSDNGKEKGLLLPGGSLVIKLLEGQESQGLWRSFDFLFLSPFFPALIFHEIHLFFSIIHLKFC